MVVLGDWAVAHERGTPVTAVGTYERWCGLLLLLLVVVHFQAWSWEIQKSMKLKKERASQGGATKGS